MWRCRVGGSSMPDVIIVGALYVCTYACATYILTNT